MTPTTRTHPRIGDHGAERAAALIEVRNEHAAAVIAAPDAWASADLPGWVRDRFPGIDLADPSTLPEPERCAEGRPWGADPWGPPGIDLDRRWRDYADHRGARPCRNRWRDRATLLCGTHVAAWQRTRDEARTRIAKVQRQAEATELARQLGTLGVVAEAGHGTVRLHPADARALIEQLVELRADRTTRTTPRPTETAGD